MKSKQQRTKKIRLNVDLAPRVRDRVDHLRLLSNADSMSEVIRRSLAIYEVLLRHVNSNGEIILHDPKSKTEKIMLLDCFADLGECTELPN